MSINNLTALCSADTAVGATYTDITGCSFSLTAGTWFLFASISAVNGGTTNTFFAKLYNSTDTVDYNGKTFSLTAGFATDATVQAIVTVASTKTVKLALKRSGTVLTVSRYSDGTIPGTYIHAIQLA